MTVQGSGPGDVHDLGNVVSGSSISGDLSEAGLQPPESGNSKTVTIDINQFKECDPAAIINIINSTTLDNDKLNELISSIADDITLQQIINLMIVHSDDMDKSTFSKLLGNLYNYQKVFIINDNESLLDKISDEQIGSVIDSYLDGNEDRLNSKALTKLCEKVQDPSKLSDKAFILILFNQPGKIGELDSKQLIRAAQLLQNCDPSKKSKNLQTKLISAVSEKVTETAEKNTALAQLIIHDENPEILKKTEIVNNRDIKEKVDKLRLSRLEEKSEQIHTERGSSKIAKPDEKTSFKKQAGRFLSNSMTTIIKLITLPIVHSPLLAAKPFNLTKEMETLKYSFLIHIQKLEVGEITIREAKIYAHLKAAGMKLNLDDKKIDKLESFIKNEEIKADQKAVKRSIYENRALAGLAACTGFGFFVMMYKGSQHLAKKYQEHKGE